MVLSNSGLEIGIVGCTVGASFEVLVAQELFASGGDLLICVSSGGQIAKVHLTPYFVFINRAPRDEGIRYHYVPPSHGSEARREIIDRLTGAFDDLGQSILLGASSTPDAPFRESEQR